MYSNYSLKSNSQIDINSIIKNKIKNDAIFGVFDKNKDGKISQTEYDSVTKELYDKTINNLRETNQLEDEVFLDYDELKNFLDADGIITTDEVQGKKQNYNLKDKGFEEIKTLKDVTQMSTEEIVSELQEYDINTSNKDKNSLKKILLEARDERANFDKNSEIIDGHIGTFVQGDNSMCTFLSAIETMTDEQVRDLYRQKTDENGKIYYEVTFPSDKGNRISAIITQEELNKKAINITEEGQEREVAGFSSGDIDVIMLEMAYTKRFGTDLFDNGGWIDVTKNNVFSRNGQEEFVSNKNPENITNLENIPANTTISVLKLDDLFEKGNMLQTTLSDGRFASFSGNEILISDGTIIPLGHAMSVRGYDKATNELIVSGSSFNSTSELRIPAEMLKYFEMALPRDFE